MARLDFVVSQSLKISKAQAQAKIRAEQVRVNGSIVRSPSWQVVLGGVEEVTVEGEKSRVLFHRLLLMHKPRGCVTARRARKPKQDGEHSSADLRPTSEEGSGAHAAKELTVFDVMPKELDHPSIGPFGRLDKDTTGLLLLGSDGGLQSLLMHPAGDVTKQYLATLRAGFELAPDAVAQVAAGLTLADGTRCAPTTMEIVTEGPPVVVKLTLHEGVNHQVKRMIGQLGGFVDRLHRVSVGPLQLVSSLCGEPAVAADAPGTATIPVALEEGEVRLATDAELRAITQFLPQERDYPQLADAQRAVMLKRESGKTTRDKGRRQTGTRGKRRRVDEGLETPNADGHVAREPKVSIGAVFFELRRLQRELCESSAGKQQGEMQPKEEEAAAAAVDELLTECCDATVPPAQRASVGSELASLREWFPNVPVASQFVAALRRKKAGQD